MANLAAPCTMFILLCVFWLLADNQPPAAKRIKRMLPSDHVSVIIYISLIVFIEQAPHKCEVFAVVCLFVVLSICSQGFI